MKTPVAKWVPRKSLSRKPKSAEAMELDKEEKAWQHQLYRARQAKERAEVRQALKDRQREIERANELEERSGERKRKSVRGCIVGADLAVLNLVVIKQGDAEIEGLTDTQVPVRLGPKRANKIRKLFALSKEDDVRKYVIARKFDNKKGKQVVKAPKIQRLITPIMLQRKRARKSAKMAQIEKTKAEGVEYNRIKTMRMQEQKDARRSAMSKRRSSRKSKTEASA